MKKRGRHRIRTAEYWRAYYTRKQREWRAAHPRARRRRKHKKVDWPSLPTREEYLFLRQNDYWTIRYHGDAALLKSTRGLHYLAVLLRDPGREFHVRELLARPIDVSTPAAVVAAHGRVTGGLYGGVTGGLYAGVPVLDAQAKAEYKCRVNDLRLDLNQAERFNDLQRKTEVQYELQAIVDHLASAVGLGGRDRKTSSDAERARSAVTKCIKKAVQKIGEALPSLGYHLAARIKTGYFCSYNPRPDRPVAWKFYLGVLIFLPLCEL
jgi:non-specific serine/threonine protein kinase